MHRKSKSGGGVTRCVPNGIVLWRLLVKIGPADWQLGIEPCSLSAVLRSAELGPPGADIFFAGVGAFSGPSSNS